MLWKMQKGIVRTETNTALGTSTEFGTVATTGAAAGTKGTPVQLIASTAFDSYWIKVLAHKYGTSATASEGALDILIGAATEEILIPDLLMGGAGEWANGGKSWDFPLYIPAGTRISAQAAGARTTTGVNVSIFLSGGNATPPYRVGTKVTTYGATAPNGTSFTPANSGAWGAWAQVSAGTSEDHFSLVPSFQIAANTAISGRLYTVQMGVGAATEEPVSDLYWFPTRSDERIGGAVPAFPTFQDIPSGTRLSMRGSNHSAADTGCECAIHAVS